MSARSPITTHVLDTATGRPAKGVRITLEKLSGATATKLAEGTTNDDGRITDLLAPGSLEPGTYQMTFHVADYFAARGERSFYPRVPVVFTIESTTEHYHVPLLLSPYGYSTYRGS
jgi:5-hydroxyisourate hydrolase